MVILQSVESNKSSKILEQTTARDGSVRLAAKAAFLNEAIGECLREMGLCPITGMR